MDRNRWSRIVIIVGVVCMILGAVDPLEGSLIILPGIALVAAGAAMSKSRYRVLAYWALGLAAAGIGLMFWISSRGGFGGPGRPMWWGLVLLPYPVGWLLGLVAAIRTLREKPAAG